jgi:hypothetical protein
MFMESMYQNIKVDVEYALCTIVCADDKVLLATKEQLLEVCFYFSNILELCRTPEYETAVMAT